MSRIAIVSIVRLSKRSPLFGDRVTIGTETERVHPQDGRGQGDIIALEYPAGVDGPNLGLVINADCDLANGKTDGTIAYLPIFSFRDYLAEFWIPGYLSQTAGEATKRLVEMTNAGPGGTEDLAMLLNRFSPSDATARLCHIPTVKLKDHKMISSLVSKLAICRDNRISPYTRFERLCHLYEHPKQSARSLIEGARKNMGDGHFFISDLVDRPEVGFVIRMRRIYSLAEEQLFNSVSAQRARSDGNQVTAVRFARLASLYRFRVLQLFAQQFSRVGLPDEVIQLSSLAVDDLVSNIADA